MQSGRRVLAASVLASLAVGGVASAAGASAARIARPHAAATTSVNPALTAAADAAGDQYVLWKGQDNNLWFSVYVASTHTWTSAAAVAGQGPLGSEPSVAYNPGNGGPAFLDVFWQGADNNLWMTIGSIASAAAPATVTWTSPSVVAGMGPLGSKPVATYVTAGAQTGLYVFWKGADGNLWSVHSATVAEGTTGVATWPTGPSVIPGNGPLGSEPSAASDAAGDVFAWWQGSGNNTRVWEAWYNHTTAAWSGPIDLGAWSGNTGSAPTASVDPATGNQYVFWQGQDGNLWYEWWNGGHWQGFNFVGQGPMNSKPAVAIGGTGTVSVFWKGTDANIWTGSNTVAAGNANGVTGAWTGPTSIGMGPIDGV